MRPELHLERRFRVHRVLHTQQKAVQTLEKAFFEHFKLERPWLRFGRQRVLESLMRAGANLEGTRFRVRI